VLAQPVVALLAVVAARAFDVGFAATLAGDHAHVQVGVAVAHASLQRAHRVTVTVWRSKVGRRAEIKRGEGENRKMGNFE